MTREHCHQLRIKLIQYKSTKNEMMVECTMSIISQSLIFDANKHVSSKLAPQLMVMTLITKSDLLNARVKDRLSMIDALTVFF